MGKFPAILCGLLIALLSMPGNLGELAGGSFQLSIIPIVLTVSFLYGLVILFTRLAAARAVSAKVNRWLLAFLALATVSTVWSGDPAETVHRLYRLYAEILVILSFALVGWYPRRFQGIALTGLTFLTVASIVYRFTYPDGAIQPSKIGDMIAPELVGAWRGVTLHKNTMGAVATTSVILWAHALFSRQVKVIWSALGILAGVVCLVGSRSSTSMFSAVFSVGILLLLMRPPSRQWERLTPLITTGFVALFLVYSLGVLNIIPGLGSLIQPLVALSGKDMSFSGRTTIWEIMKMEIAKHPLMGIGYAAFWTGPEPSSPSYEFITNMYVWPSEAHNGYLDVINEIGVIGGAALIAYLFTFIHQCQNFLKIDRSQAALYIALLFAEFIANLSEAHWWNLASVNFFILTMVCFDMARAFLEAQRRPPRAAGQTVPPAVSRPSLPTRRRAPFARSDFTAHEPPT